LHSALESEFYHQAAFLRMAVTFAFVFAFTLFFFAVGFLVVAMVVLPCAGCAQVDYTSQGNGGHQMNLQAVLEDFKKADNLIHQGINYLNTLIGTGTVRNRGNNVRAGGWQGNNARNVIRGNPVVGTGNKRKLTVAAKRKIALAMKARWAAKRAAAGPVAVRHPAKKAA